jgi:hypothetical protein
MKELKNGNLINFQRGQVIGVCLAGASMTKTAALVGVSRATFSKVMLDYTNHGKATLAKKKWAKISIDSKCGQLLL